MIEMYEGVPGSGKTYHAVSAKLLLWVRAGRRIYAYVDGVYLDRLALFEGIEQSILEQQITIWMTADDVKAGLLRVEPGSGVLIDEVQTVFRSRDKTDPELLRWLETHRHRGIDVVLMCQQYGQVTLVVNRLVEATTKFRRLDRFGLKNRYQASVRGNPEELDVIRMFTGKYEPKLYAYYSSYSQASIRETARGGSILKSPTLILGVVGLVGAVAWFAFGGWLSGAKPAQAPVASRRLSPPPALPVRVPPGASVAVPPSEVKPIRIQGGMTSVRGNALVWLWVSEDGRVYTEEEMVAESGGTVISRIVRGVRVLTGTGVVYGGVSREATVPDQPRASAEISSARVPQVPQPVATAPAPPDVEPSPPSVFATPAGF